VKQSKEHNDIDDRC